MNFFFGGGDPKLPQQLGGFLQRPAERIVTTPGGVTTFSLPAQPRRAEDIVVTLNGVVKILGSDFSWDKKLWLTFGVAPPLGQTLQMRVLSVQ